jgi:sugar fermentation stimulation protein A
LVSNCETLIEFPEGSFTANFCRREKRFLVEIETQRDRFWAHCNNSGSMLGLLRPGCKVLVAPAKRAGRRLLYTLELIQSNGSWVGVNTLTPNRILRKAWELSLLPEIAGYHQFKSEAKIGLSRLDACLIGPDGMLWIEAKNVTLAEDEVAYFPDAITQRGQRHLTELIELAKNGKRVACFFLIQRPGSRCFAPADFIDSRFAELFWRAVDAGVEMWPYEAIVSLQGIGLRQRLPLYAHHQRCQDLP